MVCTGMRWRRMAEMVSRSMPPALSAPSLSSTMAPSGSEDDSASTRSSVSPMRVAGAVGRELLGLLNPFRLLTELVEPLVAGAESAASSNSENQLHTTPHRLRSSHSQARIPSASRKIAGMSHRSRVSRVEMPASEYEISFASLDASPGL